MQAWEEKYYSREEGFEDGIKSKMMELIQEMSDSQTE